MNERPTPETESKLLPWGDTGLRRYRIVPTQRPTPAQPKGWVLEREVPHDARWSHEELKKALDGV